MDSQHIPGLSLAVVREGKLELAQGYGKASVELDAPTTPATLFALASVSKQFTAAAIMLLVAAGQESQGRCPRRRQAWIYVVHWAVHR